MKSYQFGRFWFKFGMHPKPFYLVTVVKNTGFERVEQFTDLESAHSHAKARLQWLKAQGYMAYANVDFHHKGKVDSKQFILEEMAVDQFVEVIR